jgi:hypothetical protein
MAGNCLLACESDEDCEEGEICSADGVCVECESDEDCEEGEICSADGVCVESLKETICDDGYDNDFDGLVDCDDPDCEGSAECVEYVPPEDGVGVGYEICDNYIDDDNDGLVDCDDPDCEFDEYCIEEEEEEEEKEEAEKEGKGWLIFLIILIILILACIGLFLYMKKTGKGLGDLIRFKKKKGPSFDEFLKSEALKEEKKPAAPLIRPALPVRPRKEDKLEEELEKSIREAEKLLHGGR